MTAPLVTTWRTTSEIIRVGPSTPDALGLRVEIPERWNVARIEASPATTVRAVRDAALQSITPGDDPAEYVIKLRGFEVLDENVSLADAGARNGSIFLLTHRRRRPVR